MIAVFLVVLASGLAALSVVSRYVHAAIVDEDRYLAMVAPLAEHPEIQQQVVDSVTDLVVSSVRLDELSGSALEALIGSDTALGRLLGLDPRLADALRTALSGLGPALQQQLEATTRTQTERIVTSPEFAGLWRDANRSAHRALVAGLTGGNEVVQTTAGEVTVDLAPIVAAVKQRMITGGFILAERIPVVEGRVVVLNSSALAWAQQLLGWLDAVALRSWWVTLLVAALAIAVAPARRLVVVWLGAGVAAAMGVLAVVLALGRAWLLGQVPPSVRRAAVEVVVDAVVGPLQLALRTVLVLGLVVMIGALVAGPAGTGLRTGVARARSAAYGPRPVLLWQRWLYRRRILLRATVLVLAVVVLAFWSDPGVAVILGTVAAAALILLALELLARPPGGTG